MNYGFIKIHREISEKPFFTNKDLRLLFFDLVFNANFKKDNAFFLGYEKIIQQPGDLVFSQKEYSIKNKVSIGKVNRLLNVLKSEGICEIKRHPKCTLIKVLCYDGGLEKGKQNENKMKTKGKQNETIKKEKKEKKDKYKDFVKLTKEEHQKLIENFGEITTDERIEKLNSYIGSKGTKYKSHYHTILNWSKKNEKEKPKSFEDNLQYL